MHRNYMITLLRMFLSCRCFMRSCAVSRLLSNPNTVRRRHCKMLFDPNDFAQWRSIRRVLCVSLGRSLSMHIHRLSPMFGLENCSKGIPHWNWANVGMLVPPVCVQVHGFVYIYCCTIDAAIDSNDQFCSCAMCDAHTIGRMNAATFIPEQNRNYFVLYLFE